MVRRHGSTPEVESSRRYGLDISVYARNMSGYTPIVKCPEGTQCLPTPLPRPRNATVWRCGRRPAPGLNLNKASWVARRGLGGIRISNSFEEQGIVLRL